MMTVGSLLAELFGKDRRVFPSGLLTRHRPHPTSEHK
ncbi:rCG59568 [Rattus norvegicus]|uniref:RCG59568 n=1 Tax=Rattus norvegicus TaxID=10116 RepID=A6HR50_RAT|nr:rCG59568 [Rattus norvegicus]